MIVCITAVAAGILIISILLFECFRRYGAKLSGAQRPLTLLSEISFGIYFVHVCIMEGLELILKSRMEYIPYFWVLWTLSFVGSVVIIQILRRYKKLSQLLFRI